MNKAIIDGIISLAIFIIAVLMLDGTLSNSSYSTRQLYASVIVAISSILAFLFRGKKTVRSFLYYAVIAIAMLFIMEFRGYRAIPFFKLAFVFIISFASSYFLIESSPKEG